MTHDQQTAAAALLAACEALDAEAGTNLHVQAVHLALDRLHATLPLAERPHWNALAGIGAAYVRKVTDG